MAVKIVLHIDRDVGHFLWSPSSANGDADSSGQSRTLCGHFCGSQAERYGHQATKGVSYRRIAGVCGSRMTDTLKTIVGIS